MLPWQICFNRRICRNRTQPAGPVKKVCELAYEFNRPQGNEMRERGTRGEERKGGGGGGSGVLGI